MIIQRTVLRENINLKKLINEISENITKYEELVKYGDVTMSLQVDDSWNSTDDTDLDNLILAHDPTPIVDPDQTNTAPLSVSFGSQGNPFVALGGSPWKTVGYFFHPGSNNNSLHTRCRIAWTATDGMIADIRVIHRRKGLNIICEQTNLTPAQVDVIESLQMGNVSNIPKKPTMCEVQVQGNLGGGGNRIKIAAIQFI